MVPFTLTAREHGDLQALLHSPAAREPCRAQALLWLAQGYAVGEIADLLGVSRQTVYNWARRFAEREGETVDQRLADAPRVGRPPTALGIIDPLIAAVIDDDPRHWGYQATGWTNSLLRRHLRAAHHVTASRRSVSRALARLGIRWKRPRHQLALRPDTWRQSKGGSKVA